MIGSLLVANRAECACRVMRTAAAVGINTVAVYSEGDSRGMWVRMADEAHCIGPDPAARSYLNIDAIVAVAKRAGVDAVHPGYGLLSENADFAESVRAAGIIFVGPSTQVIAQMADKVEARLEAQKSGIPILQGTAEPVTDAAEAHAAAERIGWPVVIKAVFGGGGKGLRVAKNKSELQAAYADAAREAWSSFGKPEVFVEAWLPDARHIEVQILGDREGNIIHLGDRDCSLQRRRQKLIEEAPAPELSEELRQAILEAAVGLAKGVGYEGAGTVEFLVEPGSGDFHFLEMNTRLQVEHAVTECITGLDIVAEQLRLADGAPLGIRQKEVVLRGHAMEARIVAENPAEEFRPEAGELTVLAVPGGAGIRNDFGVTADDRVSPYYDSLLGKVVAWGENREAARRRLLTALHELRVGPMATSGGFLAQWLARPDFIACTHNTGSIEKEPMAAIDSQTKTATVDSDVRPRVENTSRLVQIPQGDRMRAFAIHNDFTQARLEPLASSRTLVEPVKNHSGNRDTIVRAPLDALVMEVTVCEGDRVARGDRLVTLEAMKMEVAVRAPSDGMVAQVFVAEHSVISSGTKIIALYACDQGDGEAAGNF